MNYDSSNFIQISGKLFNEVQQKRIFPDSKTFVDSVPKYAKAAEELGLIFLKDQEAPPTETVAERLYDVLYDIAAEALEDAF